MPGLLDAFNGKARGDSHTQVDCGPTVRAMDDLVGDFHCVLQIPALTRLVPQQFSTLFCTTIPFAAHVFHGEPTLASKLGGQGDGNGVCDGIRACRLDGDVIERPAAVPVLAISRQAGLVLERAGRMRLA